MSPIFIEEFYKGSVGFEVLLTSHCNLKCKGCMRYSNIAKPEYYSFEKLKQDFLNFKRIDYDNMYFCLTGGEPLLHPNFLEIAEWLVEQFPTCAVATCTNAMLFTKQTDEWYRRAAKCIGIINYTRYNTDRVDYDKVIELCEKYGIEHNNVLNTDTDHVFHMLRDFLPEDELNRTWAIAKNAQKANPPVRDVFYNNKLSEPDEHSPSVLVKKYIHCKSDCLCIWDGKIWMCSLCSNAHILNTKYGTNFIVSKDDYIDMYELKSRNEIFDFWCKPISFCKYCFNYPVTRTKWEIGNPKKSDFIGGIDNEL